jgi:hypothetical protein
VQRYFFHVRDGTTTLDDTGFECATSEQVRTEALRAAGETLKELGSDFWDHPHWTMWVEDEAGGTVLTLSFSGTGMDVTSAE